MLIPFREILRRAGARLSNTSTSTSESNDLYPKLKDWCQEIYERIYWSFPWDAALEDNTLTIVASQLTYILDRDIGKIWTIFDEANARVIKEGDVQGHDRFNAIDHDQTGNVTVQDPLRYYKIGKKTVKSEIGSSAEKIDIVSTSALDLTPNVVHVAGLVSGIELSEDIILNGTSSVSSSNTYDANQKLRINTGTNDETRKTIVGAITVDGNTSETVFSKISPSEFAPEYIWIRVSPKPKSSGTQPTWRIWYTKRQQFLIADNDIPIIDIGLALIEGIEAKGLREDGQEAAAVAGDARMVALVQEKMDADVGPNRIEAFVPQDTELITTLDFGRVIIGGNE